MMALFSRKIKYLENAWKSLGSLDTHTKNKYVTGNLLACVCFCVCVCHGHWQIACFEMYEWLLFWVVKVDVTPSSDWDRYLCGKQNGLGEPGDSEHLVVST